MQPLILVTRCWQEGDNKKSAAISLHCAMGCHHPILGLLFHVKLPLCSRPRGGPDRKGNKKSLYQCFAHTLQAHSSNYAIGAEWNKDGSSCFYTQVSSKPSRTCTVRATCSTSAADQYHIWKHEVPTAFVAPSSCPATPQSALHPSPHCASATSPTRAELCPSPGRNGEQGVPEAARHPLSSAASDSTHDKAGTRAELSGLSQQSCRKGMNRRNDTKTGIFRTPERWKTGQGPFSAL